LTLYSLLILKRQADLFSIPKAFIFSKRITLRVKFIRRRWLFDNSPPAPSLSDREGKSQRKIYAEKVVVQ